MPGITCRSRDNSVYKQADLEPNQPMGQAVGIFPGRVFGFIILMQQMKL